MEARRSMIRLWLVIGTGLVLCVVGAVDLYAEGIAADAERRAPELTLLHWPAALVGALLLLVGGALLIARASRRSVSAPK
jgi:hypothetical protein